MKNPTEALAEIYGFRAISERLGTAGQPTESQLKLIQQTGYEAVINLALTTSDNALANEGSIVTELGMAYVHIPVDFAAPDLKEFHAFCQAMAAFDDRRIFVHCAANKRVSAFVFLYRILCQRTGIADAAYDLQAIWQPDEVWSRFIQTQLKVAGH